MDPAGRTENGVALPQLSGDPCPVCAYDVRRTLAGTLRCLLCGWKADGDG